MARIGIHWFRNLGLKNKIFFSILAVLLMISVVIALLARYILVNSLTSELERRGLAIASSIGERGSGYVLDKDKPGLVNLVFDAAQLGERKELVAYIFISNTENEILAHTFIHTFPENLRRANQVPEDKPQSVQLIEYEGQGAYDIAVPMKEGIYQIATVHVGLNKSHIDKLISKLRNTFLGFITAVIIITFAISNAISKYITDPVSRLIKMSDEISKGNLDFRIDLGAQYSDLLLLRGDEELCPAYHNSDLPCWHVDKTMGQIDMTSRLTKKPAYCNECVVRRKQYGDEVLQLADSFAYMIRSIKLFRSRLRESEAKYRSLFDAGPDPIFVLDRKTLEVLDANPRVEDVYGYAREEIQGMSFKEIETDDAPGSLVRFERHGLGHGECLFYPKVIHQRKDGQPIFVNMHACATSYADRPAVIVSTTDITDMIEKDAQIIQASKMTTLGEMSAGIAHEINQPLNAIRMGSDYLSMIAGKEAELSEKDLKMISEEMSAQVDRATEIINTLRNFGRKADLVAEKVDINEPVRAIVKLLRRQLALHSIELDLHLNNGMPYIRAHSNRLQQVFFNLLTNARDAIMQRYESNGEGPKKITIRSYLDNQGNVSMSISDTGTGIDSPKIDKIFEPFYTTKETGQGMGLGLAISYGIVKDYRGDIRVESRKGEGTTFKLFFPPID
jgi:histidine kinase